MLVATDASTPEAQSTKPSATFLEKGTLWLSERFISLYEKYGKEDIFSSYLEDENFQKWETEYEKVPILSFLSEKDEYAISTLTEKFKLMGEVVVLAGADHCVTDEHNKKEIMVRVFTFCEKLLL
eukprot:Trichotokara_eunicae@DN3908_c0_g1_i1.p2